MSATDHTCEAEEVCAGLAVMLGLELLRPLCPQRSDRELRSLLERHAELIAAHMLSAGVEAASTLFNAREAMS